MRAHCGAELNMELIRLLQKLTEALQVKNGMETAEDYGDAVAVIHDFPAMTIEEIRLCFAWIRQGKIGGKLYERFKARDLRACLCEFEGMRAEQHLEPRHKQKEESERVGPAPGGDIIKRLIADLGYQEPQYTNDWLKGKRPRLTHQQRRELQERDRQRRS